MYKTHTTVLLLYKIKKRIRAAADAVGVNCRRGYNRTTARVLQYPQYILVYVQFFDNIKIN